MNAHRASSDHRALREEREGVRLPQPAGHIDLELQRERSLWLRRGVLWRLTGTIQRPADAVVTGGPDAKHVYGRVVALPGHPGCNRDANGDPSDGSKGTTWTTNTQVWLNCARHNGVGNVAFADGHVKAMNYSTLYNNGSNALNFSRTDFVTRPGRCSGAAAALISFFPLPQGLGELRPMVPGAAPRAPRCSGRSAFVRQVRLRQRRGLRSSVHP